jgi:FkbM family methyltransferase
VRAAAALIGRLPAGRSRAAARIAAWSPRPFIARAATPAGDFRFWCDLADEIARDACLLGAYEPQVTRVVEALVTPGATVVDVGANWGYFALLAARLAGPDGRVIALEPDPRPFALLERNRALNAFEGLLPLPLAAGAGRETVALDGYADGATNRGVSRTRRVAPDERADLHPRVASVALDALLDEHGIGAVDLVKIDVEGAEDGVLAGMMAGLRTRRYRRVLIELHPSLLAERGVTADACCEPLRAAGYRGWAFDHTPGAVRRATYARAQPLAELIRPSDRVPIDDPWPHMLWSHG